MDTATVMNARKKNGFKIYHSELQNLCKGFRSLLYRWDGLIELLPCSEMHRDSRSKEYHLGEMLACTHCSPLGDVVRTVPNTGITGRENLWIELGDIPHDKCVEPYVQEVIGLNCTTTDKAKLCINKMGDERKAIESVLFGVALLPTTPIVNLSMNGETHYANVAKCMPVFIAKTKAKCEEGAPEPSTSQAGLTKNNLGSTCESTTAVPNLEANQSWGSIDDVDLLDADTQQHHDDDDDDDSDDSDDDKEFTKKLMARHKKRISKIRQLKQEIYKKIAENDDDEDGEEEDDKVSIDLVSSSSSRTRQEVSQNKHRHHHGADKAPPASSNVAAQLKKNTAKASMPFVQAKPLKKLRLKGIDAVKHVVDEAVKQADREANNKRKVEDHHDGDDRMASKKPNIQESFVATAKQKKNPRKQLFAPIKLDKFQDISDDSSEDELSMSGLNPLAQSSATELTVEESGEISSTPVNHYHHDDGPLDLSLPKRKRALSRKVRKNPETIVIN